MAGFPVAVTEIQAMVTGFASGPEASAAFAALAAQSRDEVVARDAPSSVATFVDGREGAPLTDVKVPGVVRFEFGYLQEIVEGVLGMLVDKSPQAAKRPNAQPPTHYRDEHAVFIDGVEVAEMPGQLSPGATVTLVNLSPYSRKIERGLSMQAPSGVYEAVARLARARWGNAADIEFGYDVFPGAGPTQTEAVRTSKTKSRRDDRFPRIEIKAYE